MNMSIKDYEYTARPEHSDSRSDMDNHLHPDNIRVSLGSFTIPFGNVRDIIDSQGENCDVCIVHSRAWMKYCYKKECKYR